MKYIKRYAFTLVEIIVAAAVALVFFSGIIYLASSTGVETTKAENYLRALQIAQETIELIQSVPVAELTATKLQAFEGSLVKAGGGAAELPFNPNSVWKPETHTYPEQYNKAYFYRRVKLESLAGKYPNGQFLSKVVVEVFWNEGRAPKKIEAIGENPDRMRKLALATIIFNDLEPY